MSNVNPIRLLQLHTCGFELRLQILMPGNTYTEHDASRVQSQCSGDDVR